MITAVDSSVLIAISKREPAAEEWVRVLADAAERGDLVFCEVVAAEYFALILDEEAFTTSLDRLRIRFRPVNLKAAQMAGWVFRRYRREGGPREHLIPDFLIGAHASCQADQIAANDRGFLRRYFPRLRLVQV